MIDKVGAVIIKDKKMLVAREKDFDLFFVPGGKREIGESDEQTLRREIMEELGTGIKNMKYYKEFITDASGKANKIRVRAYFCELSSAPEPCSEIEEIIWADKNTDEAILGNVLKVMIPELTKDGYL